MTAIKHAYREPLVHFLLIGFALFAAYGVMNNGKSGNVNYQIALTFDDLKQLDVSFVSQWHRQPTPEEFNGLVESFIRQEVLYREGLAMDSIRTTPSSSAAWHRRWSFCRKT